MSISIEAESETKKLERGSRRGGRRPALLATHLPLEQAQQNDGGGPRSVASAPHLIGACLRRSTNASAPQNGRSAQPSLTTSPQQMFRSPAFDAASNRPELSKS